MSNYSENNLLGKHCERIYGMLFPGDPTEALYFTEAIYYLAANAVLKAVILSVERNELEGLLAKICKECDEMKVRVNNRDLEAISRLN